MPLDYSAHDGAGVNANQVPLEEKLANEVAQLRKNIARILRLAAEADEVVCTGPNCRQQIVKLRHKTGSIGVYNYDGSSHFATCVDHELFRRNKHYAR